MNDVIEQQTKEAQHGIVISFYDDGSGDIQNWTTDPEDLAARFAKLIRWLVEHPGGVRCAAGLHARKQT